MGLKEGAGAILEVWRPIAGQGPGLYRLELDEAQSVDGAELFAGSAWVLLRRVLQGDLPLLPEVHWLDAGSLPESLQVAAEDASSLLALGLESGQLLEPEAVLLSATNAGPAGPVVGITPAHNPQHWSKSPRLACATSGRLVFSKGKPGQSFLLKATGQTLQVGRIPAAADSPGLVLLSPGVELRVVLAPDLMAQSSNPEVRGEQATVPLSLGLLARKSEAPLEYALDGTKLEWEFDGLTPHGYSAFVTRGSASAGFGRVQILAQAATGQLTEGSKRTLELTAKPDDPSRPLASLSIEILDAFGSIPRTPDSLNLRLERTDLPPEQARLERARDLVLMAVPNGSMGKRYGLPKSASLELTPGAYELYSPGNGWAQPFELQAGEQRHLLIELPEPCRAEIQVTEAANGAPLKVDLIARWIAPGPGPAPVTQGLLGAEFYPATLPQRISGPSGWYELQALDEAFAAQKLLLYLPPGESSQTAPLARPPRLELVLSASSGALLGSTPGQWHVVGTVLVGAFAGAEVEFKPQPGEPQRPCFHVPFPGRYRLAIDPATGQGPSRFAEVELRAGATTQVEVP